MSYFYLAVAVCSLGMLGVLHKVADHRQCRPEAINLFLFFWASAILLIFCLVRGAGLLETPLKALGVAAICGTLAGTAILFFQRGVRYGRISTSWLVINLSTIVPTVLAILVYHEKVSVRRAMSLALALASLGLLWLDRRREEQHTQTQTPKLPETN
jgi:drug/metabolite transporter (DMT)-like permease